MSVIYDKFVTKRKQLHRPRPVKPGAQIVPYTPNPIRAIKGLVGFLHGKTRVDAIRWVLTAGSEPVPVLQHKLEFFRRKASESNFVSTANIAG